MSIEIKNIKTAVGSDRLCRCRFDFFPESLPYYILAVSDKFLLAAREEDFLWNGYEIRLLHDLKKAEFVDDALSGILKERGVPGSIVDPSVEISSFYHIFASLYLKNELVFVESTDGEKNFYDYGKILRVGRESVLLLPFDENGLWMEDVEVFYDEILGITFGDRYNTVWKEYLDKRVKRAKKNPVGFVSELLLVWNPAGFSAAEQYQTEAETVVKLLKKAKTYAEFAERFFALFDEKYPSIQNNCYVLETIWVELKEF